MVFYGQDPLVGHEINRVACDQYLKGNETRGISIIRAYIHVHKTLQLSEPKSQGLCWDTTAWSQRFVKPWPGERLGGSVVERLALAQVVILGSSDRVLYQAPHGDLVSPSACVSASLSVSS